MAALPEQLPTGDTVSPLKSESSIGSLFVSVYDIFLEVCRTLLATKDGRADLLRLATVNRAVSDVALDVLWEKQNTITNLFRILPRIEEQRIKRTMCHPIRTADNRFGMPYMYSVHVNRLLLTLQGPDDYLTDVEYSRFLSYAARIKVLKDRNHKPEVHPLIDERLLRCALQKGPILPNVHTLHIGWATETTLDGVNTEVQASDNGSDVVLAMVHDYYACIPIETLGVFAPISHIRSLSISPGRDYKAIPHLRHLVFLEELHLFYFPGPVPSKAPAPAPGFRALRTLRLSETHGLDHAYKVLQVMSSEPLRLHELQHYDLRSRDSIDEGNRDAGQHEARRFFRLLRDRVDCNSLTTLRVTTGRGGDIPPRKLFSDLRAFPNISTINVYYNHEGADINGAVDVLTTMWPGLTALGFANRATRGMSCVTLAGLVPIATRCPGLSSLSIPLDLWQVPEPIQLEDHEVLEDRAVQLDVQDISPREDMEGIVRFLASIFPAMTLGCIYAHESPESSAAWYDVAHKVRRASRRQSDTESGSTE
ncbi:hypothetical protein BD626DRAFT_574910 [Schizophyllum amplum]|uniref:F-box domain-containing protein n=1 Tax=Schizophyllum amplum TaxID=97359 RepID=A0A550BX25_9AGAR|nr:hypothetical protein BD626DRAFT_574910 [Auriculariopsis ampla]